MLVASALRQIPHMPICAFISILKRVDLLCLLQAMNEIKELAPHFIEGNKDVDFTLHTAKFYQEASHGKMPEAIAYSRAHMTPLTHNSASRTEMLKASSWVWQDTSAACHH